MKTGVLINDICDKTISLKKSHDNFTFYDKLCDEYTIYINERTAEKFDINVDLIVWHELFHILCGHFNSCEDKDINLWNIACDMVINQILNLEFYPFIYPSRYGFHDNLTEEEYYELLVDLKNENDSEDNNESDKNSDSNSSKNSDGNSEENPNADDNKGDSDERNEFSDLMGGFKDIFKDIENDDIYFNTNHNNFDNDTNTIRCTEAVLEKYLKQINNPVPDCYKSLIKEVTSVFSKRIEMVKTTYQSTYMKFNNRKSYGKDILVPGRKKVTGGNKRNFNYSPVVFVDISGSTNDNIHDQYELHRIKTINDALNTIAKELHDRYQAKIIFYNTNIKKVVLPKDEFLGVSPCGCTSITCVVNEAKQEGLVSDNDIVVVITDGQDTFNDIINNYKHLIYKVSQYKTEVISKKIG